MTQPSAKSTGLWDEPKATALLVLADGTVLEGAGFGATGSAVGEVCFNTAMTGYEEILTDPSYAGQIITFTFPHIGNVGTNEDDIESVNLASRPVACGVILHSAITPASNYRATRGLNDWLKVRDVIGLSGIDTRALTSLIRQKGMPNAVIAHAPDGKFDLAALKKQAREWPGLVGMDLVPKVTSAQRFTWDETPWEWGKGYGRQEKPEFHVVAVDYGIKRNILRLLAGTGFKTKASQLGPKARAALGTLGRQALHAYLLTVEHPETGDVLEFQSELPADLRRLRDALAAQSRNHGSRQTK
jgi:carbamoyl-phosphate synthase small subunit